jgi:hypothetical protein
MTKIQRRRNNGVYTSKAKRNRLRNTLRKKYGNCCCWCNGIMVFPEKGKPVEDREFMATLEHYFAKSENCPEAVNLLRLSHKKCNK